MKDKINIGSKVRKFLAAKSAFKKTKKITPTYDLRQQMAEHEYDEEPKYYKQAFHETKRSLFFR